MKNKIKLAILVIFIAFMLVSVITDFDAGKKIGLNFIEFAKEMVVLLPCAFILIGLFEVWVKPETIEKHLGENSGIKGFFWMILLASSVVGGLIVALPIAYSLYQKGAKLSFMLTYLGAAAVCRIPMTFFEASFLGLKFTLIRWAVSLPLIIISSVILDKILSNT